jgi:hypothetical protein
MNRKNILLLVILFTIFFISCESDKIRKEKSEEIVKSFIANLTLDNYDLLYKYYPDFQKVKRYWEIDDFKITSTTIDEDKSISIIGTSKLGNILFNLKSKDGKYIITDSKGLASVFNSPIYKYCKKIGCIGTSDYDKDISQICSDKQDDFNTLVYKVKNNIESNFTIQNNNLEINYGYVSGNVTVKNNSRFSIISRNYEIYYHFLNSSGQIVYTKKEMANYQTIPFGQSVTEHLFESNSDGFSKIKVELKIISTDFIEEIIAENIEGNNCNVTSDF